MLVSFIIFGEINAYSNLELSSCCGALYYLGVFNVKKRRKRERFKGSSHSAGADNASNCDVRCILT